MPDPAGVDYSDEVIVELKNGRTIRSGSTEHQAGDYVRVCDESGEELQYWDYLEWEEDPKLVMGAILILARDGWV